MMPEASGLSNRPPDQVSKRTRPPPADASASPRAHRRGADGARTTTDAIFGSFARARHRRSPVNAALEVASPAAIAEAAVRSGCRSVAFTYNDPVIFLEYAIDAAQACRERGIKTVAVSAGYISPEPRIEFFRHMDAANIDLKGFSEGFYKNLCSGKLAPVLETLEYLKHETNVWLEITTLLIPGENDSPSEIEAESAWVMDRLGADVPLHFTAFHPDWKLTDRPPTPPQTLREARRIATNAGLHYVYTGNIHDPAGQTTRCHSCGATLIGRYWYDVTEWHLSADGRCNKC